MSNFNPLVINRKLEINNLTSEDRNYLNNKINDVFELISDFIKQVVNNKVNFDSANALLTLLPKDSFKEIKLKPGIYLIVNSFTKRFYLGSSVNLQQRRREYASQIVSKTKSFSKLNSGIQQEINKNNIDPKYFYFYPICYFDNLTWSLGILQNLIQPIFEENTARFIDEEFEEKILERIFEDPFLSKYKYNVITAGGFRANNKLGGYREGNAIPVKIDNYYFPSYVAASKALNIDRKTLRNQKKNPTYGKNITDINFNDYENSEKKGGTKVSVNPSCFSLEERNRLLLLIGCRRQKE